jgi:hypothetical protein
MKNTRLPRGLRNNNPGNIKRTNPPTPWQGLSEDQPDAVFVKFKDVTWGIRAMARILINYQDKYNICTIDKAINRYAPESDGNSPGTYIGFVSKESGINSNVLLDFHEYSDIKPVIKAMIEFELGYEGVSDSQIDKGLSLAGIEPPEKGLKKSRTIKGAQVATIGIGLTTAQEIIVESTSQMKSLIPYVESLKYLFVGLVLIGISLTVWARIDDNRKGLR